MLPRNRLSVLLLASMLFGVAVVGTPIAQAATITVVNNDDAGEGFNDPTAVAPVGGNPGSTLGLQRLIAFQQAANIWGALLSSPVTIRIAARFDPLTCNATSAILGSAGPITFFRDFTGAPQATTWYAVALANALRGIDLDPGSDDITATFNSAIGTTCAFPNVWYYGLDGSPPGSQIDFATVVLHEIGHGLGFVTLVNLAAGTKALGFNDTFMLNLERHGGAPPDYPSMSDAQRVAASTDTGNLHWVGPKARTSGGVLTAGRVGDHIRMFAPNPQQPGASVSHWDTALAPNELMEPSYTGPKHTPGLALQILEDTGWTCLPARALGESRFFDGNCKADILWRHTSGTVAIWLVNGTTLVGSGFPGSATADWTIVGAGDFNGDGKTDILWRHTSGIVVIWFMNGIAVASTASVGSADSSWTIVGVGDFNGDGKADIFWQHTSGLVFIWLMNGATVLTAASPGAVAAGWTSVGVDDFNADGTADILWRHTSGALAIWFMNGISLASSGFPAGVTTDWTIVGVGDFNGDGRADILWQHTSGTVVVWLMNGATALATASPGVVAAGWTVASVQDFDGDDRADIAWRHSSGLVFIWLMNGTSIANTGSPGSTATSWVIQ